MLSSLRNGLLLAALCLALAACAGGPPMERADILGDARIVQPERPLQCVPYARARAHLTIYGDAYTWWNKAAGHYARGHQPQTGAVLVLDQYAGAERAHLAVVRALIGPREIRIDHANWLDGGEIHLDDPVYDVSDANDWSAVRVFNLRTRAWGTKIYHVKGFIGPGRPEHDEQPGRIARQSAVRARASN